MNERKKQPGEVAPRPVTAAWLAALANTELLPKSIAAARQRARTKAELMAQASNLSPEDTAAAIAAAENGVPKDTISTSATRRWLRACGFKYFVRVERGLYVDGHERPDVVIDRRRFLSRFLPLVRSMHLSGWTTVHGHRRQSGFWPRACTVPHRGSLRVGLGRSLRNVLSTCCRLAVSRIVHLGAEPAMDDAVDSLDDASLQALAAVVGEDDGVPQVVSEPIADDDDRAL